MSKFSKIPSEIRNFFSEKRINSIMETMMKQIENLSVERRWLGADKRENCQLTNLQVLHLLILLPFFAIKGISHYSESGLNKMFGGKKDVLYSFLAKDDIDWRTITLNMAVKFIFKIINRKDFKKSHLPSVLICDDSDLPKTGMHMEKVGKIFSHVHHKSILGYKLLLLMWSDGKSQFALDASLHGEIGKIEGKQQGLTAEQRKKRHSRERDKESHTAKRMDEYFMNKGEKLIEMLRKAIKAGISFEYLLVDSWFTNTALVEFVCRRIKKIHLLGMARMGKTKYGCSDGVSRNARSILERKSNKDIKYSRKYRCHYACEDVMLGKRKVRLFFCRRTKNEGWKILLTTDMSLDFLRAYEIYSMRWAIEVFFSDSKRLLDLAGCSCRDFSSQIAHVSLVIIRYNMLAFIKRYNDYETIGGVFNDVYSGIHELTVVEKIWAIILEVVAVVADLTGADEDTLIMQIIENDERLKALRQYAQTA